MTAPVDLGWKGTRLTRMAVRAFVNQALQPVDDNDLSALRAVLAVLDAAIAADEGKKERPFTEKNNPFVRVEAGQNKLSVIVNGEPQLLLPISITDMNDMHKRDKTPVIGIPVYWIRSAPFHVCLYPIPDDEYEIGG